TRAGVQRERAAYQFRRSPAMWSPEQGAKTRAEFLKVERLADVVVRTGVEPGDLVLPAFASSEDEDREGALASAPSLDDLQARHLGETEVYDCSIDRVV